MARCKNCKVLEKAMDMTSKDVNEYAWCPARDDSPDIEIERECDYYEVMTQADRIRNMTDEELAEFIQKNLSCNCGSCFLEEKCTGTRKCCYEIYLEWLQSPVEV